jgi:hypothetical protein
MTPQTERLPYQSRYHEQQVMRHGYISGNQLPPQFEEDDEDELH